MHLKSLAHNKSSIKDSYEHDVTGLLVKAVCFIGMKTEAERFRIDSPKVPQLIPSRAQTAQVSRPPDPIPDLLIYACNAW